MALTPKTKRRIRRRNSIAHDLHHPKYKQRVVSSKKIYKRKGVGYQGETARDYDEVIILSTAAVAVALMVRPFDMELANELEAKYDAKKYK